jgi:hypothetical protein
MLATHVCAVRPSKKSPAFLDGVLRSVWLKFTNRPNHGVRSSLSGLSKKLRAPVNGLLRPGSPKLHEAEFYGPSCPFCLKARPHPGHVLPLPVV